MKTYRIVPHQSQSKEEEGYRLFDVVVEGEETTPPLLNGVFFISVEEYLHQHINDEDVIIGYHPRYPQGITGAELREKARKAFAEIAQRRAEWKRRQVSPWLQWLRFRWRWLIWDIEDVLWHLKERGRA